MEVEKFIKENKHLGYITRKERIKESIRFKPIILKSKKEYIEIPKEMYERLNITLQKMSLSCNAKEFINEQINAAIRKSQVLFDGKENKMKVE